MKHHILFLLSLLIVACDVIPETEFTDRPVVCCYLSPGETASLTVEKLIPFKSDAAFCSEDISKLTITISDVTTGDDYLMNSMGDGLYQNDGLVVVADHTYRLNFDYDGVPVSAETVIPSTPESVSLSASTIEVMSFPSKAPQDGITVSWKNDEGDYYIVEGRTTSTNCIMDVDDDDDLPSKSFKLSYTQGTDATLSSTDFSYYGTYQIYVIHISYDYAVMSQGGSTSSSTLVDMKGNIDGGYGIFTGISTVKRSIKVTKGSGGPF